MEKPATSLWAVFIVTCGILALLMQPRHYLNDELVQAASLDGLASGHIWISGNLPHFADLTNPGPFSSVYAHPAIPAPGQRGPPIASLAMSFLALPGFGLGKALAAIMGVRLAVTLPAFALAAGAAVAVTRELGWSRWVRNVLLTGVALLFLPVGGIWNRIDMGQQPTLEFASLILVSILANGVAAAYLFDLMRRIANERVAMCGTMAFLATPLWFWSETGKYSSLSVALVVLAMWAFEQGFRGRPLHTALAFALAGLAVWNQLPWGVFLLAGLGVAAIATIQRSTFLRQVGAASAGLAIGMVPDVLTHLLLLKSNFPPQFGPSGATGSLGFVQRQLAPGGLLGYTVFTDPVGVIHALYNSIVWTSWREDHYALGLLATAPLIGCLIALSFRRPSVVRLPRALWVMGLAYVILVFAVMGREFLDIGGGADMRYGLTFWPFLVVGLAPILYDVCSVQPVRATAALAAFGALAILLVTIAVDLGAHAAQHNVTPQGIYYDQTIVVRCVGPILAGVLAMACAVPRWSQSSAFAKVAAGAMGVGFIGPAIIYLVQSKDGPFVSWIWPPISKGLAWIIFRHIRGFDIS